MFTSLICCVGYGFVASQAVAERLLLLTSEVQTAKQRVGLDGDGAPSLGSLEYAVLRLEEYANDLESRVVLRFDGAASVGDIAGMQECALIMSELMREMTLAQVGTYCDIVIGSCRSYFM